MKKIISMLLAVMMIATLTVTAFAAGEKGSITIEHPEANATYSIYKILDLESYNNTTKTYSYKIAAGWEDFFKAEGANYVNFVMDDNDTPDDTADDFATAYIAGWKIAADDEDYADSVKAFTEDALAYAQTKGITAITADGDTSGADVTVNNLDLGYYLIDTNMGTLCGLTTTKPTATVTQKHYLPALEKEVQENSAVNKTDSVDDLTEGWVSENDANINDTVYFKITVTAKAGAQDYVVHDAMSDGLTFKEIVSITHEKKSDSSVTDVADYTLSTTAHTHADDDDATDDITCDFSITFGQTFCDTLETEDKIVIIYTATLNEEAVIAGDGNPNEAWLNHGNNNDTAHDDTVTKTYEFDIIKTDENKKLLDGAQFKIYTAETGGTEIGVIAVKDDDGNVEYYRPIANGETAEPIIVKDGQITVKGFDTDTYWLQEIAAPDGYNMLTARQKVEINDANLNAQPFDTNGLYTSGGVQVVNKTGTQLPETGGMGTTLFITFGTIAVLGTGVLLVTKKRMGMIQD